SHGLGGAVPRVAEPLARDERRRRCDSRQGRGGRRRRSGVPHGRHPREVDGVPVFDPVATAVSETGANTAMVFVPAPFAADAMYEAIAAGIATVVCITEGVPAHEMLRMHAFIEVRDVRLVGPNCPGALSPGKANVGIIP